MPIARDEAFEAWRQRALDADILKVAQSVCSAKLKHKGAEWIGPCPMCSSTSKKKVSDRFAIRPAKQIFNCRGSGGGKVISMVMHCRGVEFLAACELITGEPPPARGTQLTPEQRAKAEQAKKDADEAAAVRDAKGKAYRESELKTLSDMWQRARPFAGSSAEKYYGIRGLTFPETAGGLERIGCIEMMPYYVTRDGQKKPDIVHRGPAKVMPIVNAKREFCGLHLTYIDLADPKGKLNKADPIGGELLDVKKSRGSKQGNRVELIGPADPERLIMGEADEKVVGVYMALIAKGRDVTRTAFWSACDLGNLAGPAADNVWHPTLKHASGKAVKVQGATPDFAKPAIVIPESVSELIILGDSTSDRLTTQLAMARAAVRYGSPGCEVKIAWAPAGIDFDDPWRDRDPAAADIVCAAIDAAGDAPSAAEAIKQAAPARASAPKQRGKKTGDAGDAGGAPNDPLTDNVIKFPGRPPVAPAAIAAADPDNPPSVGSADRAASPAAASAASDENEDNDPSRKRGHPGARAANRSRWKGPPRKFFNDGGGDGGGNDDNRGLDRWLAFFPQTELGMIERYVQRQKHRLKFSPALGWLFWDGKRWAREGAEGEAIAAGHDVVRALQNEADAILGTPWDEIVSTRVVGSGDDKQEVPIYLSDTLAHFGRESETKARMTLHEHARPYLEVKVDQLDADPFAINTATGTIVIRREWEAPPAEGVKAFGQYVRFKPHDPADLITKLANVEFVPGAKCPTFDKFMDDVQPNKLTQAFLDEWYGYSLIGDAGEQKFVFDHGTGKNGKSTALAIRLHIAGEYGRSVPIETFVNGDRARAAGQATPDLAMLRRVRVCATSEPEKNWKLNEALIKHLTGNDRMSVRELHGKYFDLDPEFKLTIAGNYKPDIKGGEKESGMWRRVVFVPWNVKISKEQQDLHIGDKLKKEASGILNRWLRGLIRWLERGLVLPPEVADATEQFRVDSDPLGRFLAECTEHDAKDAVGTTQLYELFVAWCKANGEREWTHTTFGKVMGERGYIKQKISVYYWKYLKATKKISDFLDDHGRVLGSQMPHGVGKGERNQSELGKGEPRDGF